jgi:hypothetical protein
MTSTYLLLPLLVILLLLAWSVWRIAGHLRSLSLPDAADLPWPAGDVSADVADDRREAPRLKPLHQRRVIRDPRMSAASRRAEQAPAAAASPVLSPQEARRLFAGTLRTRDRRVRDLLTDPEQLTRHGLPAWDTEFDVAGALGLSVSRLRYFSVHRARERILHYVQFAIPKRDGGERVILAPKRELKALLRRLNVLLVTKLPVSEHAHGFLRRRSIATHTAPHVGQRVVVRLDLKDFFPSIHVGRVRGLLVALGYSYRVAATLATLMTEAGRQPVQVGEQLFFVPVGSRHLPQGAPTSPGLANAMALVLDRRLAGLARSLGFNYTRYADDLTFSGRDIGLARALIKSAQRIVHMEGFALNPRKTRVMTQRGAQRITGVTLNRELGLSRRERRRLRAALHQARGAAPGTRVLRKVQGGLAYLSMLNPRQAQALRDAASRARAAPTQ